MNNTLYADKGFCDRINYNIGFFEHRAVKVFSGKLRVLAKRVSLRHISKRLGMSHQPIDIGFCSFGISFFGDVLLYLVNVVKRLPIVLYSYGITFFHVLSTLIDIVCWRFRQAHHHQLPFRKLIFLMPLKKGARPDVKANQNYFQNEWS